MQNIPQEVFVEEPLCWLLDPRVSDLRRLKQLEDENTRLRRSVADLALDKHMLEVRRSEHCTNLAVWPSSTSSLRGLSEVRVGDGFAAGVQMAINGRLAAMDELRDDAKGLWSPRGRRRASASASVASTLRSQCWLTCRCERWSDDRAIRTDVCLPVAYIEGGFAIPNSLVLGLSATGHSSAREIVPLRLPKRPS